MKSYDLLNEKWISVIYDERGSEKNVSLLEVFENAHLYKDLAGDTPAQNFAILRFLLSILQTVYSRFDAGGKSYEYVELDKKFIPVVGVDEDDEDDYLFELEQTWVGLWESEKFTDIIGEYLKKWSDRFDLFGEEYPFYQISEKDMEKLKITKKGELNFRLVNRILSESNNKIELFSSITEENKDYLSDASLTRWIITFQGFTGTGDKAKFPNMKESASKGWLMGLGGLYLQGENLKQTLLLNLILSNNSEIQTPIWEKELEEKIEDLFNKTPDNLAELYTSWSRLLLVNDIKDKKRTLFAVQLPGIESTNFFLEPMTMWRGMLSKGGEVEYVPRMHNNDEAFWRNFGVLCVSGKKVFVKKGVEIESRRPGIMQWYNKLVENSYIKNDIAEIVAVGMSYNKDASTMPNGEIYDVLNIYNEILLDSSEIGWVKRIDDEVDLVKRVIDFELKVFAKEIANVRNIKSDRLVELVTTEAYFSVDVPFREWILNIRENDEKEEKIKVWRKELKNIIIEQADKLFYSAGKKDVMGKFNEDEKRTSNIITAYNYFVGSINKILKIEGGRKYE